MLLRRFPGWGRRWLAPIVAVLVATASASHAITLIYKTSSTGNQIFDAVSDPQLVDLGEATARRSR